MELKQGRPQEKRISKEERVYDLLEKLHIDYQRIDHEKADTMEICLEIEKSLQATICKNLFLVNSNKSQYYLLMLKGHKKFKTKNISKQINSSRLSFGSDEKMHEYLDITPGSVSVLGLMNDVKNNVQLLMDQDLLEDEYLGCHPCIMRRFRPRDPRAERLERQVVRAPHLQGGDCLRPAHKRQRRRSPAADLGYHDRSPVARYHGRAHRRRFRDFLHLQPQLH